MGNVISLDAFRRYGEVRPIQEESVAEIQQAARPSCGQIIDGIQFVNCENVFDPETLCVERFSDPRDRRNKMRVCIETSESVSATALEQIRPTGRLLARFGTSSANEDRRPWVSVKMTCEPRMYSDGSLRQLFIFTVSSVGEEQLAIFWHRNDGQKAALCFCC